MRLILLLIFCCVSAQASELYPLENPKTGPIVGHTTDTSTRLTGYAWDEDPDTFMYLRYKQDGSPHWRGMHQVVKPAFDHGATFFLEGLSPETTYQYQMGFAAHEDDTHIAWDSITTYTFKTFATSGSLSFAFGSCRMYKNLGCLGSLEHSDRIMSAINQDSNMDFWASIGDQVYADIGNPTVPWGFEWVVKILQKLLQDKTEANFKDLYRAAFSTPNFRTLCASLPTYLMGDDHEVVDNYRIDSVDAELLDAAMRVYATYQAIHTPAFTMDDYMSDRTSITKRWFLWNVKGYPFFMLDQRNHRTSETMHGPEQLDTLIAFLSTAQRRYGDKPKFVFSPVCLDGGEDTWAGYPVERNKVLQCIRLAQSKNVFVLCGDEHSSFATTITCDADPGFRVAVIVSSPLYWPFIAVGRGRAVVAEGEFARVDDVVYHQTQLYAPYLGNGFTEINVDDRQLTATLYDADRVLISQTHLSL